MKGVQILAAPTKSVRDPKDYKQIQLPNGLKALLISEPSLNLKKEKGGTNQRKSAAALCIGKFCKTVCLFVCLFVCL